MSPVFDWLQESGQSITAGTELQAMTQEIAPSQVHRRLSRVRRSRWKTFSQTMSRGQNWFASTAKRVVSTVFRRQLVTLPLCDGGGRGPYTALVATEYGIKPVNHIVKPSLQDYRVMSRLTPGDIRLEQIIGRPDFLVDSVTAIGRAVQEMPYFGLMDALHRGLPLEQTEYCRRAELGTLDWRFASRPDKQCLQETYRRRMAEMDHGQPMLVRIYSVFDDLFTVADGNHRLALATYHQYPNVVFEVVPCFIFDSFYWWIFEQIAHSPQYHLHHEYLRKTVQSHRALVERSVPPLKVGR
jgi:hypothetical protein